jgi:hypothetical protein
MRSRFWRQGRGFAAGAAEFAVFAVAQLKGFKQRVAACVWLVGQGIGQQPFERGLTEELLCRWTRPLLVIGLEQLPVQDSLKQAFRMSARRCSSSIWPCHIARQSARSRRVMATSSDVSRSGKPALCIAEASQRPTRSSSSSNCACSANRSAGGWSTRFWSSHCASERHSSYQSSAWALKCRTARSARRWAEPAGSATAAVGVPVVMPKLCPAHFRQARLVLGVELFAHHVQRCTRAPPPFMSFLTSSLLAMLVSPGVVIASAVGGTAVHGLLRIAGRHQAVDGAGRKTVPPSVSRIHGANDPTAGRCRNRREEETVRRIRPAASGLTNRRLASYSSTVRVPALFTYEDNNSSIVGLALGYSKDRPWPVRDQSNSCSALSISGPCPVVALLATPSAGIPPGVGRPTR